jgi:hypothetical protein
MIIPTRIPHNAIGQMMLSGATAFSVRSRSELGWFGLQSEPTGRHRENTIPPLQMQGIIVRSEGFGALMSDASDPS